MDAETDPLAQSEPARWGQRGTAGATIAGHLAFERVSRRFSGVAAVSNVSFELKPGEIACLLGPSGCGKTTLLRIAAGIERPSRGQVLIDGTVVAGQKIFVPPEQRNIGLMFQDFALFPHLNILDNVAFGLRKFSRSEAEGLALHALQRVGLAHLAKAYPHNLSGGEQQRVALARAVVPRPQVMLMDEPFSGLDQRLRESVRAETLALLRETRASCLLVTHDPVEAMGLADRIFLMRKGRLIQSGTPQELYRGPVDTLAARFFSDANELSGQVRQGEVATAIGKFAARSIRDGDAQVLVRPQGIMVSPNEAGVEALVLESRYLGDVVECRLLFAGLDEPLVARLPAPKAPQRGETRHFIADPDHVLVFSRG